MVHFKELTDAQVAELRADLEALSIQLAETVRSSTLASAPVELDQAAVGRISRIDAIQLQQMAVEQQRRAGMRLEQVRVALREYDADEYGWCGECGEAIGYARMKARPESARCIACTQAGEKRP
jgi:DnaK suppressor protein